MSTLTDSDPDLDHDDDRAPSRLDRVSQRLSDDAELARTAIFAATALGLLVLAVMVSFATAPSEPADFDDVGEPFYPSFADAAAASGIRMAAWNPDLSATQVFEVKKEGDTWVIPTHSGYPVEAEEQLADAATALIGVTRGVLSPGGEQDFANFGLVDPLDTSYLKEEGRGQRVTLTDETGEPLVDLIVGRQTDPGTPATGADAAVPPTYYVRRADENRIYQAQLDLDVSTRLEDWVDPDLLTLDRSRAVLIDVFRFSEDGEGETSLVRRETPDADWTLDGLTAEAGTLAVGPVNDLLSEVDTLELIGVRRKTDAMARALAGERVSLGLEDQLDLESRGFGIRNGGLASEEGSLFVGQDDGVGFQLIFGTAFTGSPIDIEIGGGDAQGKDDGEEGDASGETLRGRYVIVQAVVDESLLPPADEGEEGGEEGDSSDRDAALAAATETVDRLNERFADWYYVISNEAFAALSPSRDSLIETPEADEPAEDSPSEEPGAAEQMFDSSDAPSDAPMPPSETGPRGDATSEAKKTDEPSLSESEQAQLLDFAREQAERQQGEAVEEVE